MRVKYITLHLWACFIVLLIAGCKKQDDFLDTKPGYYWATVDLECIIIPTGKAYRQNYVLRFCLNDEMKITQYYEYGNPLKIAEALRPLWKLFWGLLRAKISTK